MVALSSPSSSSASATLSLRVDVQNLPRAALDAGRSGKLNIRVASDLELPELKRTLRDQLIDALDSHSAEHASMDFDLEVYDPKVDRFHPLGSMAQLSRRSRLNVVLHTTSSNEQGASLALPARKFSVDTCAGGFRLNGHSVFVEEVANSGLGTGLTTWDGSVVLAKYLEQKYTTGFHGKRVLEVGAGTGLVGLSAALIGGAQQVILTDLEYTMANLNRNIQRTMAQVTPSSTRVDAQVLDWFNPRSDLGDIDIILASDVVWVEELIAPLVRTMRTIVETSPVPTTILMSHQQRSVVSDAVLFRELDKHGFQRRDILESELHPDFVSEKIQVWEITLW